MLHNISAMGAAQRKQLELEKQASMLIQQQRLGKKSRTDIEHKVNSIEDTTERQRFKNALNKYLKMKPARKAA